MKQIYIGNIPLNQSEQDLQNLFSEFGEVISLLLVKDAETGKSRGFGFVQMVDDTYADKAISALEGRTYEGKILRVNEARPIPSHTPRDTW